MRKLISKLYEFKDEKYLNFNKKIVVTNKKMIGVRTPIIKSLAKEMSISDFNSIKDEYYEEILLKGFIIAKIKDFDVFIKEIDLFINEIDNWAICDMVSSACKIVNKNKDKTLLYINNNIKDTNPWKVRFCFTLLLNYFVEEKYLDLIFKYINDDNNTFYYVMMVKAWLISKCFIKYKDETLKYLNEASIDNIIYNKAIDKICDSYRVSDIDKKHLRTMKKNR